MLRYRVRVFRTVKWTVLRAAVMCIGGALGLGACVTRPFQPAPALYTLWKKPGIDEQGVRHAMLSCGFPDAAHVSTSELTTNEWARAELCMVDDGFQYQDGQILCTYSPQLPACANVARPKTLVTADNIDPGTPQSGRRLKPAYTDWTRPDTDIGTVRREMAACGYTDFDIPSATMKRNDVASAQLCMLDKGFRYGWPYQALLCRTTPSLSACRGKSIDATHCCAAPTAAGAK
jgi:hypothetical protein